MKAYEVNFDGLVGPTHNYSGLSYGNVASQSNIRQTSNPREAALQGLAKMKALHDMGFKQAVLPPQERPCVDTLRALGFSGSDSDVIRQAAKAEPVILAAASSASCMWTANAATVSPSADTSDGRVHFTAANLNAKVHRAIEHQTTSRILQAIFKDPAHFAHHPALPGVSQFGDEGAANHTRFCADYGATGIEFFVYGREAFREGAQEPKKYPARQTLEASRAIARLHGLKNKQVVYAQQNPAMIDAGVFHNDVISVGNGRVLFYHEQAFLDTDQVLSELDSKLVATGAQGLIPVCVQSDQVSVADAVRSYLFNSQLLSRPDGSMALIVPGECREMDSVSSYLDALVAMDNPIQSVHTFDLKQSMKNGGGPACLRLRVVLNEAELALVKRQVLMSEQLYTVLTDWVNRHYRDRMAPEDLADPALLDESRTALDELTRLLGIGPVYPFQKNGH
ncbi:MAG: N-succinylarginine dihydrolase [Hahellaceae bacterium]|nr:N-succinylarginine dihydrolase [Hahellaceae bacterium]MCP5168925.1 N-succinylarginine dihydrolase [Hahellaceae bacterium]